MRIIAFTGPAGSGKSFAAGVLGSAGFRVVKFAGPLKAMLAALHADAGLTPAQSAARIEGALKETLDHDVSRHVAMCDASSLARVMAAALRGAAGHVPDPAGRPLVGHVERRLAAFIAEYWQGRTLSPRVMMQQLGTEWGRERMGTDFWVDAWENAARAVLASGGSVVTDDCRFENEAARLRTLGGKVVMILRPGAERFVSGHVSEAFDLTPDEVIENSGGEDFAALVREVADA